MNDASRGNGLAAQPSMVRLIVQFCALLLGVLLLPLLIIYVATAPAGISLWWDWANAVGFMACALYLLLTGLHVGVLLLIEPMLLEHLKLTAPLYMLAGLVASVLILLLVVCSIPLFRKRLWSDYYRFKLIHRWGALLTLGLVFFHVGSSQFYLNTLLKQGLAVMLGAGVLGYYLWRRYRRIASVSSVTRLKHSARYASPLVIGCCLIMLLASWAFTWFFHTGASSLE